MQPILSLRSLGYHVALKGQRILWEWRGAGDPQRDLAGVHFGEIKQHKAEAVAFLQNEQKSIAPGNGNDRVSLSRTAKDSLAGTQRSVGSEDSPAKGIVWKEVLETLTWEEKHNFVLFFKSLDSQKRSQAQGN